MSESLVVVLVVLAAVVLLLLIAALLVALVVMLRRSRQATPEAPALRADPFSPAGSTAGDPRTIRVGDMIEYAGARYFVRGTLRLREGGFTWSEHFLDDVEGTKRWISVEEDPDLEVVLWTEHPAEGLTPGSTVTVDGVTYTRDEQGTAAYDSEGATGVGTSGRVEYIDYEGQPGRYLAFERFAGGQWECGLGEVLPEGSMTIYPGT